jgi:hypothetical protein
MTPQDEIRRAGEARQMLDSAIFAEARKDFYDKLEGARRKAPIAATELHSRLILMEQVAGQFFGYFEQLAQTGKFAELHLAQEERRRSLQQTALDMWNRYGRGGL